MDNLDQGSFTGLRAANEIPTADLYKRHQKGIYLFCFSYLRHREDAEDATATVFEKLLKKRELIDDPGHVAPWLYAVARNTCLDIIKSRRMEGHLHAQTIEFDLLAGARIEPELRDSMEILAAELGVADMEEYLRSEIELLPDRYQEVCRLCFLQEKTIDEAAVIMDIPTRTVYGHRSKGRDLLRKALIKKALYVLILLLGIFYLLIIKKSQGLFSNRTDSPVLLIQGLGSYEKVSTLNRII